MRECTLFGVDGSVWPVTAWEHRGVFLKAEPTDLQADEEGVISGSLELVVADHQPGGEVLPAISETMSRWRRAWSKHRDCTLQVENESDTLTLQLRASGVVAGFPSVEMEGFEEFSQPVTTVAHSAWLRHSTRPGPQVQVVNAGDEEAWVSVRWTEGGQLVQPSGATVTLPSVPSPRTVVLDPSESCVVVDDSGVVDRPLWVDLRSRVFPEPVPAGKARDFTVPAGAQVLFDERVDDPWA